MYDIIVSTPHIYDRLWVDDNYSTDWGNIAGYLSRIDTFPMV